MTKPIKHEGFTPGPWHIEHGDHSEVVICDQHGAIGAWPWKCAGDEANARLIADAPRLLAENERLEALKNIIKGREERLETERDEAVKQRDDLLAFVKRLGAYGVFESDDARNAAILSIILRDAATLANAEKRS